MQEAIGEVRLETGGCVEATLIRPPDIAWGNKVQALLAEFEIGPWREALPTLMDQDPGPEVRLYVLQRDGVPFSTMMTVEDRGVGLRGNVWTRPAERRNGAGSGLMAIQMEDFKSRGGRALYLFTDYQSVAYRIYQRLGFESVEDESGHMAYRATSERDFAGRYFAPDETRIETLDWVHLPGIHPLFMEGHRGLLRCPGLGLIGRWSPEWPLVRLLNEETQRKIQGVAPRSQVLRGLQHGAVVGLATWSPLDRSEGARLVDLYCHPAHWNRAEELFGALQIPEGHPLVAYAGPEDREKLDVLSDLGFRRTRRLRAVPVDWLRPEMGRLPRSQAGAVLARLVSPAWMAARGSRSRQGGRVNKSAARTDLWMHEKV